MARGQVLAEPQWPEIDLWTLLKEMDSNTKKWQNSNHEDTIHPFLPSPGLPYFEPDLEVIFGSQLVRALPPPKKKHGRCPQGLTYNYVRVYIVYII